jgi:DNA-binding transcriptional ArsR family regulator
MPDVEVLSDPAAAVAALDPIRGRLLAELVEPASAAALAQRVGLARQKVNYHLRTLEAHGLVREAGTRQWGGIVERQLVATASSYLVCPSALGAVANTPERSRDQLSASYLVALAARAVREVGELLRRAFASEKRLATLSIDTTIAFRSPAERAAFSRELATGIAALVARYHAPDAAGARPHRVVVLAHPCAAEAATGSPSTPPQDPHEPQA